MSIDLVLLGDSDPIATSWRWGKVYHSNLEINSVNTLISKILDTHGYILFLDSALAIPSPNILEQLVESNIDVAHAGLKFDLASKVDFLDYVSPISYFNLDRSVESEITSWKVSLKCCLVKKDVLQQFPFLNPQFESFDASVLEWGYRLIWRGVIMRYYPNLANKSMSIDDFPIKDQIRFVYIFYGKKWLYWCAFREALNRKSLKWLVNVLNYNSAVKKGVHVIKKNASWNASKIDPAFKISVIIPTVDRYPYLFTLLDQLVEQTRLPDEVFIIDQSPIENRQAVSLTKYDAIGLKVIQQDQPGQCRARNAALQLCTGNLILFLDDDVEVGPDFIELHLLNLTYHNADVSCGTVHEPDQTCGESKLIRIADGFATGNSLVKRNVLLKSGLFDLSYDRGQKADGDLGARIHKSGALMILNNEIDILHHRAPSGGLRKHNVRKISYAGSRSNVLQFRLPHVTELYFNRKYFTALQQREHIWLTLLGTFSIRGGWMKKMLKIIWAFFNLPLNLYKIISRDRKAVQILKSDPITPILSVSDG